MTIRIGLEAALSKALVISVYNLGVPVMTERADKSPVIHVQHSVSRYTVAPSVRPFDRGRHIHARLGQSWVRNIDICASRRIMRCRNNGIGDRGTRSGRDFAPDGSLACAHQDSVVAEKLELSLLVSS